MTTTTKLQNAAHGEILPLSLRQAIGLYVASPTPERAERLRAAAHGLCGLSLELRKAIKAA